MENKRRKTRKIFTRVLLPLIAAVFLYVGITLLFLTGSGIFTDLSNNMLDMLDERTQNKQQPLQQNMTGRWSNLGVFADNILSVIEERLAANGAAAEDIATDAALNADIMLHAAPHVISQLRTGGATGAFVILDGVGTMGQEDTYAALFLRDMDPTSANGDLSDILMVRGSPTIGRQLNISLDTDWKPSCDFQTGSDYFFKPMEAALAGGSGNAADYGMWCGPFKTDEDSALSVITYSRPLIDREGRVLGVVGTAVTTRYLVSIISSGELSRENPGSFVLAKTLDGQSFQCSVTSGTLFGIHFGAEQNVLRAEAWVDENTMRLTGSRSGEALYASVCPLRLYDSNTPFEHEQWVIIGLQEEREVMLFANSFLQSMMISGLVALALGVIIALVASRSITHPITRLVRQLKSTPSDQELQLSPTGVSEVDILAHSIIEQSHEAADQARRLSSILSLTGTSVGVYELRGDGSAYCSRGVYQLFGLPYDERAGADIDRGTCKRMLETVLTDPADEGVWRVHTPEGTRFLRHRQLRQGNSVFGALTDVTTEMENRYRIEHERDYDVLTDLLNRRAFARQCKELFDKHPGDLKVAAMVMMDLDNLKYINDTFGHDLGDNYIKAFANALGVLQSAHSICGRRSGDEFYALLYGWDSKEELVDRWKQLSERSIDLPGGQTFLLRVSGGVAWYPEDSRSFDELTRFADFTMYTVKQSNKGMLKFFDREAYEMDAHLLEGRGEINRMLNGRLIRYVFQPIVSARSGNLLGYELLMRPTLDELSSPVETLEIASNQGVLHDVERLTWSCALESAARFTAQRMLPAGCKLFIKSIASQMMTPEEEKVLATNYDQLQNRLVMEITDREDSNQFYTSHKTAFLHERGGQVAIDHFGTGKNDKQSLAGISCEYVKLDISIVHDVDKDEAQQARVRELVADARKAGVAVLCEGVETEAEMAMLISLDVDYLQGYYIGRPQLQPGPVEQRVREQIIQLNQKA